MNGTYIKETDDGQYYVVNSSGEYHKTTKTIAHIIKAYVDTSGEREKHIIALKKHNKELESQLQHLTGEYEKKYNDLIEGIREAYSLLPEDSNVRDVLLDLLPAKLNTER